MFVEMTSSCWIISSVDRGGRVLGPSKRSFLLEKSTCSGGDSSWTGKVLSKRILMQRSIG